MVHRIHRCICQVASSSGFVTFTTILSQRLASRESPGDLGGKFQPLRCCEAMNHKNDGFALIFRKSWILWWNMLMIRWFWVFGKSSVGIYWLWIKIKQPKISRVSVTSPVRKLILLRCLRQCTRDVSAFRTLGVDGCHLTNYLHIYICTIYSIIYIYIYSIYIYIYICIIYSIIYIYIV